MAASAVTSERSTGNPARFCGAASSGPASSATRSYKVAGKQYVGIYSGIGGWIGLPVTAGLDLSDKFGAIGATAMTKAAGLQHIPQGGELNVFRLFE